MLFVAGRYARIGGLPLPSIKGADVHRPQLVRLASILILLVVAAGLPAVAESPTVDIEVDVTDENVRLMLTHSSAVSYLIEEGRGSLRIRYAEAVTVRPALGRYEGKILKQHRQRDERELILDTGSMFERYESFELRNPFRVVLDLKTRPATGRDARGGRRRDLPATIVVLDAGHGGVEHGATGPSGLMEKDVTLALARRLKRELEQTHPAISVVLTRDEDRMLPLDERTAIANHNRADLFVSIHVNASPRSDATGAETYYLSADATDDEARRLAALENLGEGDSSGAVGPKSLEMVLWDLAQNQHLAVSSALAESMQSHLNRLAGTRNRGVRQAPFRVLMGATMAAVLVEVGFISNPAEEEQLRSPEYRDRIVEAMSAAISEFLQDLQRYTPPGSQEQGRR